MTSTTNIDRWKIETYTANLMMTAEQEDSRFAPVSDVRGGLTGEKVEINDDFGNASDVVEVAGRADPTPTGTVDYDRTWVHYRMFRWFGPYMDSFDQYQMIHEPTNVHQRAGAAAVGRQMDDLAIAAVLGTRYTGRDGTTQTTFPTTAFSAGNYGAAFLIPKDLEGADTGLTVEKLLTAQACMEAREVLKSGDRLVVPTSAQERLNLKRQIEVTSKEFTDMMVLDNGMLSRWGIFDFIKSERLSTATVRRIPVFIPRYLVCAKWAEMSVELFTHTQLSGAKQLKFEYAQNWTRLHEEGVIEIESTVG